MTTSPIWATAAVAVLPERGREGLPARFALTLRPDQSPPDVADAASALLAQFGAEVAPISPTVHSELVVTLRTKTLDGADPTAAFAAGYALADELGVATADPDCRPRSFPRRTLRPMGSPHSRGSASPRVAGSTPSPDCPIVGHPTGSRRRRRGRSRRPLAGRRRVSAS